LQTSVGIDNGLMCHLMHRDCESYYRINLCTP
jgi:hypothetical protein